MEIQEVKMPELFQSPNPGRSILGCLTHIRHMLDFQIIHIMEMIGINLKRKQGMKNLITFLLACIMILWMKNRQIIIIQAEVEPYWIGLKDLQIVKCLIYWG